MSLYNKLFGFNSSSPMVLDALKIDPKNIERFRNAGINFQEEYMWVYTRTGSCYEKELPNNVLMFNPYFKYKVDDTFDKTYALYFFSIPEDWKMHFMSSIASKQLLRSFKKLPSDPVPNWKEYFDNFDAENETKKVPELVEMLKDKSKGVKVYRI